MRSNTREVLLDLEEGDKVTIPVRWFDDREVEEFTVIRTLSDTDKRVIEDGELPAASIGLEGDDGHTYTQYIDRPTMECQDDHKPGSHRGNRTGPITHT